MTPVTRVVLLTPAGRAAVATLLVDGPQALSIVAALFQPAGPRALVDRPCGQIAFGRWPSTEVGEEVVVCRRTQHRIEIHCHGGQAAARAIIDTLTARDCPEISWTDWTRQTAPDLLAADALVALASATTERTALLLWQQHEGALRRAIERIEALLVAGDLAGAKAGIDDLLAWSDVGLHLTSPWKVVLAGRPNVGKSSLINALVGYRRAIVHDTPGTTRDVVTAATAIDGWPIELADTAGMHASTDLLEQQGIALARQRIAAADLVLLVFDRSEPWTADDEQLASEWPQALRVLNKCDLPPDGSVPGEGVRMSATQAIGLDELTTAIAKRLVPRQPSADQAMPFQQSHVTALRAAAAAIAEGDAAAARSALATLSVR